MEDPFREELFVSVVQLPSILARGRLPSGWGAIQEKSEESLLRLKLEFHDRPGGELLAEPVCAGESEGSPRPRSSAANGSDASSRTPAAPSSRVWTSMNPGRGFGATNVRDGIRDPGREADGTSKRIVVKRLTDALAAAEVTAGSRREKSRADTEESRPSAVGTSESERSARTTRCRSSALGEGGSNSLS